MFLNGGRGRQRCSREIEGGDVRMNDHFARLDEFTGLKPDIAGARGLVDESRQFKFPIGVSAGTDERNSRGCGSDGVPSFHRIGTVWRRKGFDIGHVYAISRCLRKGTHSSRPGDAARRRRCPQESPSRSWW